MIGVIVDYFNLERVFEDGEVEVDCLFGVRVEPEKGLQKSVLVRTTKVGRVRTCRIEPAGLSVAERWIDERRTMWEKRFDWLGDLLAEPEEE